MPITRLDARRRSGATLVEMAAVTAIFLLFLFGIIEYSRFMFIRQMMVNAAQKGARYAVVRTLDPTVETDTANVVREEMGGSDAGVRNFSVDIYHADDNGIDIGAATNAEFGELIGVEVEADYDPILPSFVFLNNTIHLRYKSLMASEAN